MADIQSSSDDMSAEHEAENIPSPSPTQTPSTAVAAPVTPSADIVVETNAIPSTIVHESVKATVPSQNGKKN